VSGDTLTRLALGVALGLGLALAAAIALADWDREPRAPTVPATAVSAHDSAVLRQTRPWVREWNVASRAWVRALDSGREGFLERYEGYTRRMMVNSLRIRLIASEIQNPRLRALVRRLGDAYRAQFRAVNDANRAVVAGDLARGEAAVDRLERADDEKIEAATALIDAYPELAGDLSQLR
jgi:hypothetical protein